MIGSLNGKVLRIDGVTALIEVGGVGYEVDMPVTCLGALKVGQQAFVYIQHVVREDAEGNDIYADPSGTEWFIFEDAIEATIEWLNKEVNE